MRTILLTLATLVTAHAHYLWIEPGNSTTSRLYFGEYAEQGAPLREKSPGRLDSITTLQATAEGNALEVIKTPDFFKLSGPQASGATATNPGMEVKDWRKNNLGIVKPMFYARLWNKNPPAPTTPQTLDILPTGHSSRQYQVWFQGRPLPKAKLNVYAPNAWSQEWVTDDQGLVSIRTPWSGLYVLEVIHPENKPGKFQGKRYETVRHRATLTLVD